MKRRVLPILTEEECIKCDAESIMLGIRHYPEEPLSARLVSFAHSESQKFPNEQSTVAKRMENDILRKATQAAVAGEVLLKWMAIHQYNATGSLNKAAYLVSELSYAGSFPELFFSDVRRQVRVSSDPSDIKGAFRAFKNVSHLFAASALPQSREGFSVRSHCAKVHSIQSYVDRKILINDWNPWRVPDVLSDGSEFVPVELAEEEIKILLRYRA